MTYSTLNTATVPMEQPGVKCCWRVKRPQSSTLAFLLLCYVLGIKLVSTLLLEGVTHVTYCLGLNQAMSFSNQLLLNMTPAKLTGYIKMFRTALLFLQDSVNICPLYMKHPDFVFIYFLYTAKHTVLSIVPYNAMCSSWHSIPCVLQITFRISSKQTA